MHTNPRLWPNTDHALDDDFDAVNDDDCDRCDDCGAPLLFVEHVYDPDDATWHVHKPARHLRELQLGEDEEGPLTETVLVCDACATPEERAKSDARVFAERAERAALAAAERAGDDDSAYDRAREDDDLPF